MSRLDELETTMPRVQSDNRVGFDQQGFKSQHQQPEEARLLIANAKQRASRLRDFGQKVEKWATSYQQRCEKSAQIIEATAKQQADDLTRTSLTTDTTIRSLEQNYDRFRTELGENMPT